MENNNYCLYAYYDLPHERLWSLTIDKHGIVSPVRSLALTPDETQAVFEALPDMFRRVFADMNILPSENTALTLVIPPFLSQVRQNDLICSGKQAGLEHIKLLLRTDAISYEYCRNNYQPHSECVFASGYISDNGIDIGLYEHSFELLETLAWGYIPRDSLGGQCPDQVIVDKFKELMGAAGLEKDTSIDKLILCGKDLSQAGELAAAVFATAVKLGWMVLSTSKDESDVVKDISGYFYFDTPILIPASRNISIITDSGNHSICEKIFPLTPRRCVTHLTIPKGADNTLIAVCCGGEPCLHGTTEEHGDVEIVVSTDASGALSAAMLTAAGEYELTPVRGKCPVSQHSRLPADKWFI